MERVCIVTSDKYLYQKIFLELSEDGEILFSDSSLGGIDICFFDADSGLTPPPAKRTVVMSRTLECDLPLPFLIGEALALAKSAPRSVALQLSPEHRTAFLHGEGIKLTETELSILALLVDAKGHFVSREALLDAAFKRGAAEGAVNVYIHYLREKLERNGEKIIISSRKYGYKVDEKYLEEAGV